MLDSAIITRMIYVGIKFFVVREVSGILVL